MRLIRWYRHDNSAGVVGGTIGTRVGKYVPEDAMEIGLGVIFGAIGVLVLGVEFVV